ncbi:MAG: amino acid permease [Steroidobacteraceae bacterium]
MPVEFRGTIFLRPEELQPRRGLTLTDAVALVIGTVIGTGVFLKAAVMAQDVSTPALVLAAWVAAGALSLAGALTYAELGGLFPQAGGEYVYLREAYGDGPAFLFGWMRFTVASTGGRCRPRRARIARSAIQSCRSCSSRSSCGC